MKASEGAGSQPLALAQKQRRTCASGVRKGTVSQMEQTWGSHKTTIAEELEALQKIVDGAMGFFLGKFSTKKGEMNHREYATKMNLVKHIGLGFGYCAAAAAASSTDWAYQAFNEQLQRIAQQLSATIEALPIDNYHNILDRYSMAWCCFLGVYRELITVMKSLVVDADASCSAAHKGPFSYNHLLVANPETDFRVLGMKIFQDHICSKHHKQMCDAVSYVIKDCCERGKDLSTTGPSASASSPLSPLWMYRKSWSAWHCVQILVVWVAYQASQNTWATARQLSATFGVHFHKH
jgi:hypothetical protein